MSGHIAGTAARRVLPLLTAWMIAVLVACGGTERDTSSLVAREDGSPDQEIPLRSFTPESASPPSSETLAHQQKGAELNRQELEQSARTGVLPKVYRGKVLSGYGELVTATRVAVFRFYNTRTGAHFYTSSEAERDRVMATLPFLAYEGPAFYASGTDNPGLSPVHRFYNSQTGVHFYTISEAEREYVATHLTQFLYEGIAYYASAVPGSGFEPLYRFFLRAKGTHFYTASSAERDRIIATLPQYTYEGIGYYSLGQNWLPDAPVAFLPEPPAAKPLPQGVKLAPLGSSRMLVSQAATLNQLRSMLSDGARPAQRFRSMVDAQVSGSNFYGFEPWNAALMARIVTDAAASNRYCDYAVDQTEAFVQSEVQSLRNYGAGTSADRPEVASDSYLYVSEHVGGLAMVYDWCRSRMSNAQRQRWRDYANQAVWNVWNHNNANWGGRAATWSGWSVDNPINNYYSSFLEATMLLGLATYGENPWANHWLTHFRTTKLENQAFPMYRSALVGGGSQEGTGYGVAMKRLWRIYDWWERSTGERIADAAPNVHQSIPHMMHSIVPTLDRVAPTGDHARDSTGALFDYHRDYLLTLMRLYPGSEMSGIAKTLLANSSMPEIAEGRHFMYYTDYLNNTDSIPARPLGDLNTEYWGSGTGQFSMRSDWTREASYANFICGPYTESHAHRDQGSFVLYKGAWLAYDSNIDGLSGLEQAEDMHNLVRFESAGQPVSQSVVASPCRMEAMDASSVFAYGFANVTPVYRQPSAVNRQERTFLFIKPSTWVVLDRAVTTSSAVKHIWTLNLPDMPVINGSQLSLTSRGHRLDVKRLLPSGATTATQRWIDADVAGDNHYRHNYGYDPETTSDDSPATRVDVTAPSGTESQFLHVIGADGAVVNASLDNVPGQVGTTITLGDGRVATVRLNVGGPGGTLTIRNAGGTLINDIRLPVAANPLPLLRP